MEELSYNQNFESQTADQRHKSKSNYINNGHYTSINGIGNYNYKTNVLHTEGNNNPSSARSLELMRLKKEYHNMVRKELSKMKDGNVSEIIEG